VGGARRYHSGAVVRVGEALHGTGRAAWARRGGAVGRSMQEEHMIAFVGSAAGRTLRPCRRLGQRPHREPYNSVCWHNGTGALRKARVRGGSLCARGSHARAADLFGGSEVGVARGDSACRSMETFVGTRELVLHQLVAAEEPSSCGVVPGLCRPRRLQPRQHHARLRLGPTHRPRAGQRGQKDTGACLDMPSTWPPAGLARRRRGRSGARWAPPGSAAAPTPAPAPRAPPPPPPATRCAAARQPVTG
jgi:hypothetical protein